MLSNKLPLIIEDGLNTSYIDSLFVSLFYKPSFIQNVLSVYVEDLDIMYLQEMIYYNFVDKMRRKYVIGSQIMNEIRNYLVYCGWKNENNFIDLFEVQDLFDFLMNKCYKNVISFNCKHNDKLYMNYININVKNDNNVKNMIEKLIDDNLESYHFFNIPYFIPLFFNRYNDGNYNDSLIDIKEAIQFKYKNDTEDQHDHIWLIHSIICYSKAEKGNYYSIISDGNNWFLYSNTKLPSMIKIDICNEDIAFKIKKECVFVLYTLHKQD